MIKGCGIMIIWYITFKDIASFFNSQKKVFIWLIICMICGSFVLNYSYSFARYRGDMYKYATGADIPRYKVNGISKASDAEKILSEIRGGDFPEIREYQIFGKSNDGLAVVGSSFISENSASYTGTWSEGYYNEIPNGLDNVCAVNIKLLDYGERLKMTEEVFVLDGEEFTIKGVFEPFRNNNDIVILAYKFLEKYDNADNLWLTFEQRPSEAQSRKLEQIIRDKIPTAAILPPPEKGAEGAQTVRSNQLQYSAIIILLLVCLVSLIKYWQSVNLPAYTIYWINGAANSRIMQVAACESLVLCLATYLAGLGLNVLSRNIFTRNSPLTLQDILIGFGIFFGTFALFTLINTAKICKQFKVTNIRRD